MKLNKETDTMKKEAGGLWLLLCDAALFAEALQAAEKAAQRCVPAPLLLFRGLRL